MPTHEALTNAGFSSIFDNATNHITTAAKPVIGYSIYGNNAFVPHTAMYIQDELMFTYSPGAMFNTYESFNAEQFENPVDPAGQGQVADWLLVGGDLAVGHVREPFTFAVADNVIMFVRMLTGGVCWAEATYGALPVISWQNIVIGDPLAKYTVIDTNTPPALAVFPSSLDLGTANVGTTNAAVFTVQNIGNGTLTGTATVESVDSFVVADGSPFSLTVGQTTNVTIQFAPAASGMFGNDIIFASNGGGSTNPVSGRGTDVPVADFIASPTTGQAPLMVTFDDLSTGTITNRFWNFGDGSTTNITTTNIVHTYTAAGTNTVTLIASGPDGMSTNTKPDFIVVTNPVPAQLVVTPTSNDFGAVVVGLSNTLPFQVINTGQLTLTGAAAVAGPFEIASGSPFNVAGGATGVVQVSFIPLIEGSFSNAVTFASNGGGSTNPVTGAGIVIPVANFSASPTNGLAPLTVTFNDNSTGTITNRFWNFGDGSTTNVISTNLVHTYTAAGTNTVTLIASGPAGTSTNTRPDFIVVTNPVPAQLVVTPDNLDLGAVTIGQTNTQQFSVINVGGLSLTGTATVAAPFAIAGGSPFNLAGGETGSVSVSFIPTSEGAFSNAVLFASDGGNSTNTVTGSGLTPGQLLVTPFSIDFGTVATGTTAQANFALTNAGGTAISGTATAGGAPFAIDSGTPFNLPGFGFTNVIVSFTPPTEGAFSNVVTFASDGGGSVNPLTGIGAIVPVASFTASPTNGLAPLGVTFVDTSIGTITNRFWDFGDGSTTNITTTNIVHAYNLAGTNTVTLIVSGTVGVSTNTQTDLIIVTNIPPLLVVAPTNIDYGPVLVGETNSQMFQVTNPGEVTLTGTVTVAPPFEVSSGSPFSVPGSQTGTVTVSFMPVAEGFFTNDLIFTSNGGDLTNQVTGQGAFFPVVDFTANVTTGLAPLDVTFTDISTGTITNRFWDFGDGSTTNTTTTNIVHTYTAGTNTVTLIASVPVGTVTNTRADFIVATNRIPIFAEFSASPTSGMTPLTVTFTNTTTGVPDSYSWNLGDGNMSTDATPIHTYSNAGIFTVSLTAFGAAGTNTLVLPNLITVTNTLPADTTPPSLAILSPVNNESFTNANITVFATASDANGVQGVTVNGINATLGVNWSAALVLSTGTNLITVIATDNSANMNATTQSVNAIFAPPPAPPDFSGPSVTITFPTNGMVIMERFIDVTGNADDPSGVASVVVTNNRGGSIQAMFGSTNWTAEGALLKLGTNRLTAVATDTLTNRSSATVSVIRVNTNYVNTTFSTTKAKLSIGDTANSDSIDLAALINNTGLNFDPATDTVEVMFGDMDGMIPTNGLAKGKFKGSASATNALTAMKVKFEKRSISFSAEGFTLTNPEPFMVAVAFGTNDLGPDAISFGNPTNAPGKFKWSYGSRLPDFDQFFLTKGKLTTTSFDLSGKVVIFSRPDATTNIVCFGIGSYDEAMPTNGWTKGSGNVYAYQRPAGHPGVIEQMELDFDSGEWSAKGSGVDLGFLLSNPTTDIRLEIADFGVSFPVEFSSKGSRFQY